MDQAQIEVHVMLRLQAR